MAATENTQAGTDMLERETEFFSATVQYFADPEATPLQLQDDMAIFLSCAEGILDTIIDAANDPDGQTWANPQQVAQLGYSASYFLQMAQKLIVIAAKRDSANGVQA